MRIKNIENMAKTAAMYPSFRLTGDERRDLETAKDKRLKNVMIGGILSLPFGVLPGAAAGWLYGSSKHVDPVRRHYNDLNANANQAPRQ